MIKFRFLPFMCEKYPEEEMGWINNEFDTMSEMFRWFLSEQHRIELVQFDGDSEWIEIPHPKNHEVR
jgi:hypothetical protein